MTDVAKFSQQALVTQTVYQIYGQAAQQAGAKINPVKAELMHRLVSNIYPAVVDSDSSAWIRLKESVELGAVLAALELEEKVRAEAEEKARTEETPKQEELDLQQPE